MRRSWHRGSPGAGARTPRTTLKMAALAPMPSASVMDDREARPLVRTSERNANLMSVIRFMATLASTPRAGPQSAAHYAACRRRMSRWRAATGWSPPSLFRRGSDGRPLADAVTIMIPAAAHVTSRGMIPVSPGRVNPTAASTSGDAKEELKPPRQRCVHLFGDRRRRCVRNSQP